LAKSEKKKSRTTGGRSTTKEGWKKGSATVIVLFIGVLEIKDIADVNLR